MRLDKHQKREERKLIIHPYFLSVAKQLVLALTVSIPQQIIVQPLSLLVVSLPCVAFIASWEPNLKALYSCLVT